MSESSATTASQRPNRWYRQFWPWFVLCLLAWGITSSLITLSFAVRNPPEIVTGDYARLGKALVDTHVRADQAEAMGLAGRVELNEDGWRMTLNANQPNELDEQLLLIAQHPTDASKDISILMTRVSDSPELLYRADRKAVPERGHLIVSNVTQDWWISSAYEQASDLAIQVEL
ncbi:MAG: FixH family protein, partial [Pseudomonadota bacterium]